MSKSIIKKCFVVIFLCFCLSVNAQSGLIVTTTGGDTQLLNGQDFSFENISHSRNGIIQCGPMSLRLSDVAKIEPFPREIVNGTVDTELTVPYTDGLQFVGVWEGANHTSGTKTTPHPGIWEFHNDGTFTWTGTDVKGQDMEGKWYYDPNSKIIVTNSSRCPALSVVSAVDDMVLVKNETYDQMYTLSRVAAPEVSLNAPHITLFRPDGFVVRVSFINHRYINMPTYKYGISYSYSDSPDVFEKVYAATCAHMELPEPAGEWTGLLYDYENMPAVGGDVCLTGFNVDDKLILRPFAEFPDGKVIYGEDLKVQVITPPADGLFLGDGISGGKAAFWYSKGFHSNGGDGVAMSAMTPGDVDAAIQKLGDGWEVPTYIPKMFRYVHEYALMSDKAAKLGLYSPVNEVSSLYTFDCRDPWENNFNEIRGFFVKKGSAYYIDKIDISKDKIEFLDELHSTDSSTRAYVIPCKRIKVTW